MFFLTQSLSVSYQFIRLYGVFERDTKEAKNLHL